VGRCRPRVACTQIQLGQYSGHSALPGLRVTCGITYTFGGLRIDDKARVLDGDFNPVPGLFAAGELVGGLFYFNYPGGSGLTNGAVFGRIAGTNAAA
jgi:tricarballylate dehydrogenase